MSWTEHWAADSRILILDSHRPYYHSNVHTSKNVIVIDDGDMPAITDIPDDEDFRLMQEDSDEAEEENFDPNAIEAEEKRPREEEGIT